MNLNYSDIRLGDVLVNTTNEESHNDVVLKSR